VALYVMIGRDGAEGSARRDEHRAEHVAYLAALERQGQLIFAGPIRSAEDDRSIGAVIVLEAASADAARRLVDADPFVAGGVYASLTLDPFRQVHPRAGG
jgi:uncharacterized protein